MRIGQRQIGPEHPPYIIAELGVNHDGSVERALELVDGAAAAKADAIKLQLFEADRLMSKAAKLAAYQKTAGESDPIEMLRRLELSIDQMEPIVERAHARGVHAIVTVFSVELVEQAERLAWDAYKTASPDIVHKPLLDALVATGRPLIVSTGASTVDEVQRSLEWLQPAQQRVALLQCVSCYPTARMHAELPGIAALARMFAGPVGYSDHTVDFKTGFVAVRFGASVLERHLTHNTGAVGPDHASSLDPGGFARYVAMTRHTPRDKERWSRLVTSSESRKRVLDVEQDVRRVSRQSITTTRTLPAGHRLARADLTFKRPGTGLAPFRLDEVVGRPLASGVEADMPLMEADLSP